MLFHVEEEDPAEIKSCDCLPDCNSIDYTVNVIGTEMKREDHYVEWNNVSYYMDSSYYGGLFFSFGDTEYMAVKRYANHESVSFLCNVGGLLGLFLGVSVMSLIEIFYFFVVRVGIECFRLSRQRKIVETFGTDLTSTLNQLEI